ncbi:MAG: addiction module protein [Magnetococcales bacterium]|nr:addiction module protein [Magnetococcales bacterium]
MNNTVAIVKTQVNTLDLSAQMEPEDAILDSLDAPAHDMDRLWSREAEERLLAYQRGEMQAIPLEEVLAKYRLS